MTDAGGEDLESAGPNWRGGVELSSSPDGPLRHWWRFDPKQAGLIHRASGERLIYGRALPEPGWHQFDYRHEDITYPLAVRLKHVWVPNPMADRRLPPRYDERAPAELRLHVWRVDHLRSAELWREWGAPKFDITHAPPFWLWSRVDRAIIDAALLWPEGYVPAIVPATEVAIDGGWLNGSWREDFFRRLRRNDDYGQEDRGRGADVQSGWSVRQLGLPLSDYYIEGMGAAPPSWSCVVESAVDLYGQRTYPRAVMRESRTGASITISTGSIRKPEPLPHPVFVVLGDRVAWAAEGGAHGMLPDNRPAGRAIPIRLAAGWDVRIDGYCSTTLVGGQGGEAAAPWLGKAVVAFDGIVQRELPRYDPAIVNHPLSSYRSWRFLYDGFINALPFCPGFEEEDLGAGMVQGDYGQIKIIGGFVGGIQRLTTEVRLKLELPSDRENTKWTKFFS